MGFPWHYIIGLIVLVLIIWMIVRVISRNKRLKQNPAKEALNERFAKGKISKEEYEKEMKEII